MSKSYVSTAEQPIINSQLRKMSPNQPSEASQSKPAAGELTTLDPLNYDVKIKVFEDLVTHGFSFPNIFSEEAYKDFIAYLVARAPPAPSDQDLRSIIERAVRNKVAPITGINFMDFYYQFSPPGGSMPPKLLLVPGQPLYYPGSPILQSGSRFRYAPKSESLLETSSKSEICCS